MLKRIHVNQHKIKSNNKYGLNEPVLTVKTYKDNFYGQTVAIDGASTVVYSPDKPLSCGAKVWIETDSKVRVYNMESRPRENNFNKTVLVERIV